jgi:hypothetical protein
MDLLKRILGVFLLVVFTAYSGGIGFAIHNCEHCHQQKMYLFQHPDCCSAAKAEHHHQAENCENSCCADEEGCCGHQTVKNANAPHCQPCCLSEFRLFKIQSSYFASTYEKLANISDFAPAEKLTFYFEQYIPLKIDFPKNNPDPPPLLPCGERFIIFSHQLLFYA